MTKLGGKIWYIVGGEMKHTRAVDLFFETDPEFKLPLTQAYLITNRKFAKIFDGLNKRSDAVQIFYALLYQIVFYTVLPLVNLGVLRYKNTEE